MKVISLHQPFAHLIAAGIKRYETRSWARSYRGLLAIHAAGKYRNGFPADVYHQMEKWKFMYPQVKAAFDAKPMVFGAVICVVELIDIYRTENCGSLSEMEHALGNYEPGRAAWRLKLLKVYDEPIPCRGKQGLFDWSEP